MATATEQQIDRPAAPPAAPAPEPVERAEPPSNKRRIVIPIVVVVLLLALIWGFKQISYGRSHASTDNAQVQGHIIPVLAKVGGYVTAVNAIENQNVAEGTPVVLIDDAEFRVRLAQAEADLAGAQASAGGGGTQGQAQAAVQSATSMQAVTDAQIAAARANAEKARADLARFRELADKQIISRQQLDAAQATAAAQEANLLAVERQAGGAGANVSNAEAGVRLAQARLAAARAARDNAQLQLSYTKITAPAAGMVSRKSVEVGQLVQPGQTLLSIVPDSGAWVNANFKETQLANLKVGQHAELEVDAYGGCVAEGTVESLSAATGATFALLPPDNATGNFTKVVQRVPVRIHITKGCGPQRPLRPGMSVNVHVDTK